tara:strand:- start:223 stop:519 length:297 start_codon:yes stop_codon:yes gene_type:complete
MSYKISNYTRTQARRLGVKVKPSTLKNKKIDVIYNGKKIASVGDIRYKDYSIYLKESGRTVAEARRSAYRKRHAGDSKRRPGGIEKQSRGYFARQLLW